MKQLARHIIFKGRVQGVGFRFTAYNVAKRYDLTGMVRNLPDGSVEMIAQGQPSEIDCCIRDISESFSYNVTETNVDEVPMNTKYTDFKITF
jgi:acylphosphatase